MNKILIMLFFMLISIELNAHTQIFSYSMGLIDTGNETIAVSEKFLVVHLHCMSNRCELECRDPDSQGETCDFGNQTTTWIHTNKLIYEESNAVSLFDYAIDQINLQVLDGTYTNNLIIIPLGKTYYRTVEWVTDLENLVTDITVTISDGIE